MANSKFKIKKGLKLDPQSSGANAEKGDLEVLDSDSRLHYHDGTSDRTLVDQNTAETLTNKSIDADNNTITNIDDADIKAAAGIDATKIADGSVDNTEFQYLDGVTGDIQAQINSKEPIVTKGDLTEATSSVLTILGGTDSVIGSGASIEVAQAGAAQAGYLSSTDWNTFNNKQAADDYITDLTGDVTASGPGSVGATIAAGAVDNTKLADMAAWTIKARNNASSGDPQDVALADLTEEASPATGDFAIAMLSTGEIRKVQMGNIPGTGGGSGGGSYEMFDSTAQSIAAAGAITFSDDAADLLQVRRVQGNTANAEISASSTPFGAAAPTSDGLTIRVIGQSDTQPLKIVHTDSAKGAILNGDAVLYKNSMIELQWDATADRWIEVARAR